MRIEKFKADHLDLFDDVSGPGLMISSTPRDQIAETIKSGNHYSFFTGRNILGCIGFSPISEWRCIGWALLQKGSPKDFIMVHRATKQLILTQPWLRIEVYVDPAFKQGIRWVRLLGFTLETPYKPFYLPDGSGASEWIFIK